MEDVLKGNFRPDRTILKNRETKWVFVRAIEKPRGSIFVGLDAVEAVLLKQPPPGAVYVIPGVCVAESREELDRLIEALKEVRECLPK